LPGIKVLKVDPALRAQAGETAGAGRIYRITGSFLPAVDGDCCCACYQLRSEETGPFK